jgi:hypothetical protein
MGIYSGAWKRVNSNATRFWMFPEELLVGGWPTPLKKCESQLGLLFPHIPHIWKNKSHVPNHQPNFVWTAVSRNNSDRIQRVVVIGSTCQHFSAKVHKSDQIWTSTNSQRNPQRNPSREQQQKTMAAIAGNQVQPWISWISLTSDNLQQPRLLIWGCH